MRSLKDLVRFQISLRQMLIMLFLIILLPVLGMQAGIYYKWFQNRQNAEVLANLELARALRHSFWENIRNLIRQEFAIGKSLTSSRQFSRKEASEFLAMIAVEYPYLHSILWATPTGEFIAGSDRRAIGIKINDRPYFQEIVSGKEWAVSDLILTGRITGKMAFIVARGIRTSGGELQGVVIASIDPQQLGALLFSTDRPVERTITVFDSKGNMVFSKPESDYLGRSYLQEHPALNQALQNKEEITKPFVSSADGTKRASALVPVHDINWIIGASRPEKEILAPIIQNLIYAVELNLLVIFICALFAFAMVHRLVKAVRTLQACAFSIGEGSYTECATVVGPHELVQLRNAINIMVEQLQIRKDETERVLEELDRSNKELQRFAHIASHDLQEPLRMVAGFLQLLQRRYHGKLDSEADEYINYAVDGATRMKSLINDLLVFSRLNTKERPFETVDSNVIVDRVMENLRLSITRTKAVVTRDPLPTVIGDSTQLSQLFQNLVANAIKFSRPSVAPEVHIGSRRGNGETIFFVRDNGIGIKPQFYERIFIIFQRLHDQTIYPGTGLGLAICKKVVERHGGRIWVESEVGVGSTFYFSIPDKMGDNS